MGYLGAASDFDEGLAKKLKLSRTDMRCLDLIGRHGPLTAGQLAEEAGLTTGAVTFILDRLEATGMVTRRRDTEDRRRVWVEIVPEAHARLENLQRPVAEEMRRMSQRFAAEELAVVRDYMRQAKEIFQEQMRGMKEWTWDWEGETSSGETVSHPEAAKGKDGADSRPDPPEGKARGK
jgi:DNA-binding MarR family transcriptional regulator